jgi:hypothetical protein
MTPDSANEAAPANGQQPKQLVEEHVQRQQSEEE